MRTNSHLLGQHVGHGLVPEVASGGRSLLVAVVPPLPRRRVLLRLDEILPQAGRHTHGRRWVGVVPFRAHRELHAALLQYDAASEVGAERLDDDRHSTHVLAASGACGHRRDPSAHRVFPRRVIEVERVDEAMLWPDDHGPIVQVRRLASDMRVFVEQSGNNHLAGDIVDFCAARNGHIASHGGNFSVADDYGSVRDRRARRRVYGGAPHHEHTLSAKLSAKRRRGERQCAER